MIIKNMLLASRYALLLAHKPIGIALVLAPPLSH